METCRFQTVIQIRGINPFVAVSAARAGTIKPGRRKPLPVLMRINGKPAEACRTNRMPAGDGSFFLYLNGTVRSAAGVVVGDPVRIEIAFDVDYGNGPQHAIPEWFRKALHENPQAEKNWELLIPSRKKEVLRYFAALKSDEARERNLARAVDALSGARAGLWRGRGRKVRNRGRFWGYPCRRVLSPLHAAPFPQNSRVFHRDSGVVFRPAGWYPQQVATDSRK
jgi:hypothetical protein